MSPAAFFQTPAGRRWRTAFRRVRITFLFVIFLVVSAAAYLHLVGLPDFLKQELLDRLRDRGFEVEFSSARLGWGPDVLVEDASFHRADRPLVPRLSAKGTLIHLNSARLLHRRIAVESLLISQGRLELPFSLAARDYLPVTNVFLDLDLLPNDTIRLKEGRASFHGIEISLHGTVTNYLAAREMILWPAAARTNIPTAAAFRTEDDSLRGLSTNLDHIRFSAPPKISLELSADARDPDTLQAELNLVADGVQSPWGDVTGLILDAQCTRPVHSGTNAFVKMRLSAGALQTVAAQGKNIRLTADVSRLAGTNLQAAVTLTNEDFTCRLPGAGGAHEVTVVSNWWNGSVTLQTSPLALAAVSGKLNAFAVGTPWGSAASAEITAGAAAADGSAGADAGWGFWAKVNHWALDWQAGLTNVVTPKIQLDRFICAGAWRAPELVLTNFDAALYGGQLSGGSRLDVASRELTTSARFDFEAHRLTHLLPPSVQSELDEILWPEHPPRVALEARVLLPAWTNRAPDWPVAMLASLQVAGELSVGPVSRGGLTADSVQSRFTYSNRVWNVPRLRLVRPDGDLSLDFMGGDGTPDYLFVIDTKMDPAAFRPLLPEKQRPLLDHFLFAQGQPPEVHAEVWGRWTNRDSLAVRARLMATNITAQWQTEDGPETERVVSLAAAVHYTNLVLDVSDLLLSGTNGTLLVPLGGMDFAARKISFSNAVSTLDPHLVNRLLGPQTPPWLRVIGFDTPPAMRVGGSLVINDEGKTDLHFDVDGQNFRYTNLLADTASGQVNWVGRSVALTNVQATLYAGGLAGWGVFDYQPGTGTEFRGMASMTNIELRLLLKEWTAKSNAVEGVLGAQIIITGGSSTNKHSWTGLGHVGVDRALLWNIKLFGILSPVLNAIIPGSGNSRAYQASADFVVTNAMIATDNLEIHSTDFRLLYRGSLNTEKQLDARVEAKILRDTPFFGKVVSWAFSPLTKLFEYKITGTLDAPVHRPLYFPKTLTLLLEPFHKKTPPPAGGAPVPTGPAGDGPH